MSADLHLHTYYSDGTWSPRELVEKAIKLKLACIAVTDHDTLDGLTEAAEAAAGSIELLEGIEINTVWKNPDGRWQDVHILGYLIRKDSQTLQEVIRRQQQARLEQINQIIDRLRSAGWPLTFEQVRPFAGKGSIGRPHLARAMLQRKLVTTMEQAYDLLSGRDSPVFVHRLTVSPEEAVEAVVKAGGVASLAHPGKEPFVPELVRRLKSCGLGAVEAYHRSHRLKDVKRFLALARSEDIAVSGGSDCHGPYESYPPSIGTVRIPLALVEDLKRRSCTSIGTAACLS